MVFFLLFSDRSQTVLVMAPSDASVGAPTCGKERCRLCKTFACGLGVATKVGAPGPAYAGHKVGGVQFESFIKGDLRLAVLLAGVVNVADTCVSCGIVLVEA